MGENYARAGPGTEYGRQIVEAFQMGGYGAYVWSSFGLTLVVVVISAVQSRVRHHRALREITQRIKAMET